MQLPFWIIAAGTAEATDYDVGTGMPYRTVGAAVAQAIADSGDGHTVRIFDAGPYTETVSVTEAMTIRGEGIVPVLQPTDADGGFFTVSAPGAAVTIESVELDGRGEHRVMLVLAGDVRLSGAVVHDAANADGPGGAILLAGGPADRLTITDSSFTDCHALGVFDGGSVAAQGGALVVQRSTFEGGTAGDDGAHLAIIAGYGSDLLLEDSVLRNGVVDDGGGSVYLRDGDIVIRRSLFEGNVALAEGGGAFQAESTLSLLVEDSTFVANEGFGGGGAIYQISGAGTYTRNVFCDNRSLRSGGALFVDGDSAVVENSVFLRNSATDNGGAVKAKHSLLTFRHNSLAANAAGALGLGQALVVESLPGAVVTDSYFGHHPAGSEAVVSLPVDAISVASSAWWANLGGTWDDETVDLGGQLLADSQIPSPAAGSCDPMPMLPPPGSPLVGAASDGGTIGAFGGPATWPDADGDGWISLQDCDDLVPTAYPGGAEVPADGVDGDCDGGELCYADPDGDGFGDPATLIASPDLSCVDPGEAANPDDVCVGADDAQDTDADGVPDGCEPEVPDEEIPPDAHEVDRTISGDADAGGVGCGCATGSPAGLALLLGAPVLLLRRRRR